MPEGNIFNHLQIQPGELEQAKGACNFPQARVHTYQLVTIIDGLERNNLSDLISSYNYEKFVILHRVQRKSFLQLAIRAS